MKFIADFHIHSKYSRATSPQMEIKTLSEFAKLKGVSLLGTGDFTHHLWLEELKDILKDSSNGLFKYNDVNFMLTAEISSIYSKAGRVRKIHNVIFAPSFSIVDKVNSALSGYGNLASDGRPIIGIDAKDLAEVLFGISKDVFLVPGHIWTPWFSLFGSKSGFDSIEECFEEYSKDIYALETGLSCYDEKTEILTKNGWKKFSSINYSDKIFTLNPKTDNIELQNPIKIFNYKYKGKMYRLKTKRVDLLVTPNHKLLYAPCDFRNPKSYSLKEAEVLFNKSKRFKKDGIWIGENPTYFTLPGVKIKHGSRYYSGLRRKKERKFPIRSWLKFFGFWLAEGWTSKGKNGDYNVCICNQNTKLLNEMKQILASFGYRVFQRENLIRVRDFQLFHYLKHFGKSADKFIPLNIKTLSKKLLKISLEYYLKGDGHIYGRTGKGLSATTSSIRLRDDLQEMALKVGISAYYKLGRKKGTLIHSLAYKGKVYSQNKDAWVIYFLRQNRPIILPSKIKKYNYVESWVPYDGLVYCVAVPNHVVYIRREGIPIWCGNSDPGMNWRWSHLDRFSLISNSDSHSPQKIGREANVFDTDLSYKGVTDALKAKDRKRFLSTIEFFPEEGKYHFDGHRNCKVRLSPAETKRNKNICPVCGRPVTVGVVNRVEELADRPEGFEPENRIPYKRMIPLAEIISDVLGVGDSSKAVESEYRAIVPRLGTELEVLTEIKEDELLKKIPRRIAKAIINVRNGNVNVIPGFDGEYGKIDILKGEDSSEKQLNLF